MHSFAKYTVEYANAAGEIKKILPVTTFVALVFGLAKWNSASSTERRLYKIDLLNTLKTKIALAGFSANQT